MVTLKVEENLASPKSFVFCGGAVCTDEQLPGDCCWDDPILNNSLIQSEQAVTFGFRWDVKGCLVPLLKCSKWKIEVQLERWGSKEFDLAALGYGTKYVNYVPRSGYTYTESITVPANTIPDGVYEVVGLITLYDNNNNPLPVAGFAELGKIRFYEASTPLVAERS